MPSSTISQVYRRYQIMPNLQEHQLRVAAVAKTTVDHLTKLSAKDKKNVVTACLLHDMGNIIKFDLSQFPEFLEPEGLIFWETMQQSFLRRYGPNEHKATQTIAKEVGVSQRVRELINAVSFTDINNLLAENDLAKLVCEYSDLRVTPVGIVTLEDRLVDFEKRYGAKYHQPEQVAARRHYAEAARKLEKLLFSQVTLSPNQITDIKLNDTIEALRSWPVS